MEDIRIILTEQEEVQQFIALMKMFNAAHQSLNFKLLEVTHFRLFSRKLCHIHRFPDGAFTSRSIIVSTADRYKKYKTIYKTSIEFTQKFVFVCEENTFTVGYDMSFYFDVLLMCCLHSIACCNSYTRPIKILIDIMSQKYNLKCDYDSTIAKDKRALTLYRISLSFPSVTISAGTVIQPPFIASILSNFPKLPVELLHPYILYIVPFEYNSSLRDLLICIKILLREVWSGSKELSLMSYKLIFERACDDHVFPVNFQWELLKHWKMVKKCKPTSWNDYKFSNTIQVCNYEARSLIRYLKERDMKSFDEKKRDHEFKRYQDIFSIAS